MTVSFNSKTSGSYLSFKDTVEPELEGNSKFDELPIEILQNIFLNLSATYLDPSAKVCSKWHMAVEKLPAPLRNYYFTGVKTDIKPCIRLLRLSVVKVVGIYLSIARNGSRDCISSEEDDLAILKPELESLLQNTAFKLNPDKTKMHVVNKDGGHFGVALWIPAVRTIVELIRDNSRIIVIPKSVLKEHCPRPLF